MPYTVSVGRPIAAPASRARRSACAAAPSRSDTVKNGAPGRIASHHAVFAREILVNGHQGEPGVQRQPAHVRRLVFSHFQQQRAARPQGPGGLGHQPPIDVQSIGPAIESGHRLEQADVGGQARDVARSARTAGCSPPGRVTRPRRRPGGRPPGTPPGRSAPAPRRSRRPPPALRGWRPRPAPAPRPPGPGSARWRRSRCPRRRWSAPQAPACARARARSCARNGDRRRVVAAPAANSPQAGRSRKVFKARSTSSSVSGRGISTPGRTSRHRWRK